MILLDLSFDPPAMSRRAISPSPVESIRLEGKFELILPSNWKPNNRQTVWMHFHGPNWHTRDEHARAGHSEPIIHASAGEGSTVYANLFKDPAVWDRLILQVGDELRRRSGRKYLKVAGVHLSSFSAGYGAIREVVKLPSAFKMIQSVVLADSFYGSLETMEPRVPYGQHIEVWEPLAREAMAGKKIFIASVSSVPTPSYASSSECLNALVQKVGGVWADAKSPNDPDYPLLRSYQKGGFFALHYGGTDAAAHTTHIRHLAELWAMARVR